MATPLRSANWGVFKRIQMKLAATTTEFNGGGTSEATGLFQIPTYTAGVIAWGNHAAPGAGLEYCIYGMHVGFTSSATSKVMLVTLWQTNKTADDVLYVSEFAEPFGAAYFSPYGPIRVGDNKVIVAESACSGTLATVHINLFGAVEPVN